ncbi:hypothetical protein [Paenibacillus gansuensis]|uniref:Uncharacterized protein n=1 Tax=Paenibacillus gansuensis TaxID=306542 RepID=A0ABW5PAN0_9BACL
MELLVFIICGLSIGLLYFRCDQEEHRQKELCISLMVFFLLNAFMVFLKVQGHGGEYMLLHNLSTGQLYAILEFWLFLGALSFIAYQLPQRR